MFEALRLERACGWKEPGRAVGGVMQKDSLTQPQAAHRAQNTGQQIYLVLAGLLSHEILNRY